MCVCLLQQQETINSAYFRLRGRALNHAVHGHDTALLQRGGEKHELFAQGELGVSRFTSQLSGKWSGKNWEATTKQMLVTRVMIMFKRMKYT